MPAPVSDPCEGEWSAEWTTPAEVDAALRAMLLERYAEHAGCVPARALNLVCVVDAGRREEITERLRQAGRRYASRTIVCAVEAGRARIGAHARLASDVHPQPGELAVLRETVVLAIGEHHLAHLESLVDPLVVADLPTVVWSPYDPERTAGALLALSQAVLVDSVAEPVPRAAMRRARTLLERVRVVDLAWLRSVPWRERIAATFDPPPMRRDLERISAVTVRHHPGSAAAAMLLVGWLASRLGWRVTPLARHGRGLAGSAADPRRDVRITLEPSRQRVEGLAGVTLATVAGDRLSLDRAAGGLRARYHDRRGEDRDWTLLGASRGEIGILGEGIRQALLPDRVYGPALTAATTLAAEIADGH